MNHQYVVNIRHGVHYDVYVGRLSAHQRKQKMPNWGNPFQIANGRSRADCIKQHRRYALERPWLVDKIRKELRRKILGCFCEPLSCHATNLAEIAETVPVMHEYIKHTNCDKANCDICDGGLAVCKHCGGGEGSLTTECPRTSDMYDSDAVYKGERNFICGEWVQACITEEGYAEMPCHAGEIYASNGDVP